jgi:hypothetical protein
MIDYKDRGLATEYEPSLTIKAGWVVLLGISFSLFVVYLFS